MGDKPVTLQKGLINNMAFIIRDLDDGILAKLEVEAKKRGMSREAFLREKLTEISYHDDVTYIDNRYASLVATLTEQFKRMEETINLNTAVLERVDSRLDDLEKKGLL